MEEKPVIACGPVRYGLIAFGWLNVALGVIALVVPMMPTVVFLLIALWAFSRSSRRFSEWLYGHPLLGRLIRDWHAHRVIPVKGKLCAIGTMALSLTIVTVFVAENWILPAALGFVFIAVSVFVVTRPSRVPARELAS